MMRTAELQFVRSIARQYEAGGYTVVLEPPASLLPFQLDDYLPGLLAIKGDEHLIIDMKAAGAGASAEAYLQLNAQVRQHPGWRLLIVTATDSELCEAESGFDITGDLVRIKACLQHLDRLTDDAELSGLILPKLWTAYATALRLLLIKEGLEVNDSSERHLLNAAYSTGVISFGEHEEGRHFLSLRNLASRSLSSVGTPDECKQLRKMTEGMLDRLLCRVTSEAAMS